MIMSKTLLGRNKSEEKNNSGAEVSFLDIPVSNCTSMVSVTQLKLQVRNEDHGPQAICVAKFISR